MKYHGLIRVLVLAESTIFDLHMEMLWYSTLTQGHREKLGPCLEKGKNQGKDKRASVSSLDYTSSKGLPGICRASDRKHQVMHVCGIPSSNCNQSQ